MGQTDFDYGWNASDAAQPDPNENPGAAFDALPSSQDCDGSLICERCGKFHGRCSQATAIKENNMALPTGGGSTQTSRSNQTGLPKLALSDLSRTPKEAKIGGVKIVEGNFGTQVLVRLAIGGESRLWYLTANMKKNPNYKALIDKFGNEENDWVNQAILLSIVTDDVTEQQFIRVTFPTGKAGRS